MTAIAASATIRRRALKRRLARVRQGRAGLGGLFIFSAAETTVLPVPVEIVLVPMMQLARRQVWRMAASVTMGAVAGAVAGYLFALFFMQAAGDPMVARLGWQAEKAQFAAMFERHGFLAIVLVGMLPPVPFQLAMLSAGATGYPFALFVLATVIGRGARYFAIAALIFLFGDAAAALWRRHRLLAVALGTLAAGLVMTVWAVGGSPH
ncbi:MULTISPECIES: VTT domain-containing protein [unclassified Roseitalea]|uniref:YqaA family protein n=1 Tax=unclassified Roseitalea TaxID=2639107 RepID=UPI00273F9C97|nr:MULTISPECIES: VTT domain-containing protein [unclassified Roseitalea]